MRLLKGSVHVNRPIAYVSQVFTIFWALTCYPCVGKGILSFSVLPRRSRGYFLGQFVITYYLGRIMILKGESVQCSTKLSVSIIVWSLFFLLLNLFDSIKFHLISIHKLLIHKLVEFNLSRYCDTLWACALDVDISLMAGGDMAHIGERGVNLSGGQRSRLAMARLRHLYLLQFIVYLS